MPNPASSILIIEEALAATGSMRRRTEARSSALVQTVMSSRKLSLDRAVPRTAAA